jgi:hypothetical protein
MEMDISYSGLDIGVLGKFPFAVGQKLSVFSLLSIGYRIMLSVKDEDENKPTANMSGGEADAGNFSGLWLKFGGGLDVSFTNKLYLRGEMLYVLRLTANDFENGWYDYVKERMPTADMNTRLGHGLEVKLALGYRF